MASAEYSITRTRATWKPRVDEEDLAFLQCPSCGLVMQVVSADRRAELVGPVRNPQAILPYQRIEPTLCSCCGAVLTRAPYVGLEELPEGVSLDYRILGGFNNNAVECSWELDAHRYAIRWVGLKTFTGTQLKYVLPKKRSPLLFALAEEDAYAYCDESPCLECTFMCKRGFVLYAGIEDLEAEQHRPYNRNGAANSPITSFIARLPLTRMSPYWESRLEGTRNPQQTR